MPQILALNCGSSSFKFKLYEAPSLNVVAEGQASAIGTQDASIKVNSEKHSVSKTETHHEIFEDILAALRKQQGDRSLDIATVTHRIVHGADEKKPMVITKEHQDGLETLTFSHAVLVVRAALELLPAAKNVLCFDTLFHQSIAEEVSTYPIGKPDAKTAIPLKKYGFHGLSYASILSNTAKFLQKDATQTNLIICHLGSGASMCCVKNGQSIDTTMGLTPLEGLPGGTRSGSVDPSLVFHLIEDGKAAEMTETKGIKVSRGELALNKSAGFQGMTGSTDFKKIAEKAAQGSKQDTLAIGIFKNRILHFLGAYLLLLKNKPDAIIFSGGIGEKASDLRRDIAVALDYLSVSVDNEKNQADSDDIVHEVSSSTSAIKLLRVLTDEELQCAQMALEL